MFVVVVGFYYICKIDLLYDIITQVSLLTQVQYQRIMMTLKINNIKKLNCEMGRFFLKLIFFIIISCEINNDVE